MNLTEIIYENVTAEYGWGKYGDFKVLIRRKDGYINATKLCKDGGKDLSNWTKNASSEALITELEWVLLIGRTQLSEVHQGGSNYELSGTYVHPLLVPHIASWISPKFGVMASKIINNYIIKEYKEELYKKDLELGKRKDKIDELLGQNNELLHRVGGLEKQNGMLLQKLDLANENIIEAVRGVGQANSSIRGVQSALDRTADSSVPREHVRGKDAETYSIYFCEQDEKQSVYVQCRARPYHLRRRVTELRTRYPNFREVISFKPVPNARTLASEFERRIQEHGAEFDLRYQMIVLGAGSTLTEETMVSMAREVFEERRDPAEEAKEEYSIVGIAIDGEGHIKADIPLQRYLPVDNAEEPQEPTRAERFAALFHKKMDELKDVARAFPRDRAFGGWSGKPKTDLVNWILHRQEA